jgi:hypothetical protein
MLAYYKRYENLYRMSTLKSLPNKGDRINIQAEHHANNIGYRFKKKLFCAFFWVIPRRLEFIFRRFGKLSVPSS